jgi:hypothetical protein
MRIALLALALILAPGVAAARPAAPQSAIQQVGIWGQKLVAAQQPVIDAYQRCSPLLQQVMGLMRAADSGAKQAAGRLLPQMRSCVAETKAALLTSRDALSRVGPMPRSIERELNIDSQDVLRRSAAASEGMAAYLDRIEEMLDATVAGDAPLARRKLAEARATAGSVLDGQILLLVTLRTSMPLDTHKAMFDIRIALARATRVIVGYDEASDSGELSVALHGYGEAARSAATRLRASWLRESRDLRSATGGMEAMVAALDTGFATMASTGEAVGAVLTRIPSGRVPAADALHTIDRLAALEVQILAAIREISNAASRTN